jgi:hypothetical protein
MILEALFDYAIKAIVFCFKLLTMSARAWGTARWHRTEATITAPPANSSGASSLSVEIVYAYRSHGELYTGIHEEPFFQARSLKDYVERFGEGRSVVVRVKPSDAGVSVVCESDQGSLIGELSV